MHFPDNVKYLWVLFLKVKLLCFESVLCESNCVCHLLGTLIQCRSTRTVSAGRKNLVNFNFFK